MIDLAEHRKMRLEPDVLLAVALGEREAGFGLSILAAHSPSSDHVV
jgi:hypothetical protein